jgi:hypothetical protein
MKLKEATKTLAQSDTNLALAVAEAKKSLHAALEAKDDELTGYRRSIRALETRNAELIEQLHNTELSGKAFE